MELVRRTQSHFKYQILFVVDCVNDEILVGEYVHGNKGFSEDTFDAYTKGCVGYKEFDHASHNDYVYLPPMWFARTWINPSDQYMATKHHDELKKSMERIQAPLILWRVPDLFRDGDDAIKRRVWSFYASEIIKWSEEVEPPCDPWAW